MLVATGSHADEIWCALELICQVWRETGTHTEPVEISSEVVKPAKPPL